MIQLERLWLERELQQVLIRYAQLCDERDWGLLDQVFSTDASAQYGLRTLPDPAAILDMLRNHLGGCGPTQHLLANLVVDVDTPEDDSAEGDALLVSSCTAVRAFPPGGQARRPRKPTSAWATTTTAGRTPRRAGASPTGKWWWDSSLAAAAYWHHPPGWPRPDRRTQNNGQNGIQANVDKRKQLSKKQQIEIPWPLLHRHQRTGESPPQRDHQGGAAPVRWQTRSAVAKIPRCAPAPPGAAGGWGRELSRQRSARPRC